MKDDGAGNGDIQRGDLVRVLLYVDEVVTDGDLVLVQARALVPQHEERGTAEGLGVDRLRRTHDLDPTDTDTLRSAEGTYIFESIKVPEVCLHVSSL